MTRRMVLLALVAPLMLSGCIGDLGELFEIALYSESDDADVQATGEALTEIRKDQEIEAWLDRFAESGDINDLREANKIRPDDTRVHGFLVADLALTGSSEATSNAQDDLLFAESRRLAALGLPTSSSVTRDELHRNALGEVLVAQTRMLGGSLTQPWDPPPSDAPEQTRKLFRQYCFTRQRLQFEFNDPLLYLPLPPCPQ